MKAHSERTGNPIADSVPYRQIRAVYDETTITVYQAYSADIAIAAVSAQKLNASPHFSMDRMTWIKPSWCWMMYRSGYSFKDPRQSHILAIKLKHEHFRELLMEAVVCGGGKLSDEDKNRDVRVQWDPERGPALDVLPYRSIQIGVSGKTARKWVEEWIVGIEDVTEKASNLRNAVKAEWTTETLEEKGLLMKERVYEPDTELKAVLKMDAKGE